MDSLFLSILNMSLTGALVIAVICFTRLFLKRVPKIISYCLWAVAGIRLILPITIESIVGLIPSFGFEIFSAAQQLNDFASAGNYAGAGLTASFTEVAPTQLAQPSTATLYTGITNAANPAIPWVSVGAYVWLLGLCVMALYGVVSYLMLKQKLRDYTHIEDNIYESQQIKSPFVLGIIRPKIFLPHGLSADEYDYIVLHEQTHIKRFDHIVKFAAYFILAVHWFNPLAWVAFLLMCADMEMSCDERVLKGMGDELKFSYTRSLVTFAGKRSLIGTIPLAFGEGGMKERVKNVLKFKKCSKIAIACAVVLVLALSAGLLMNSSVAQGEETTIGDTVLSFRVTEVDDEGNVKAFEVSRRGTDDLYGIDFIDPDVLQQLLNLDYLEEDAPPSHSAGIYSNEKNIGQYLAVPELTEELDEEDVVTWEEELQLLRSNELSTWREMSDAAEEMSLHIEFPSYSSEVIVDTREYFLWTPEGYERDEALEIIFSLPLPAANWQLEDVRLGDKFLDYGPHVYSIRIFYTIPEIRIGLIPEAHGNLLVIAAYLFERFSDLNTVTFFSTGGGDWVSIHRGQ
ncbi:MAG: M56 family metallopeptidase [Oscillospiraceae bacterium]|nr:M56 family metallopeptidase [Oscillospiraceae bacterium]